MPYNSFGGRRSGGPSRPSFGGNGGNFRSRRPSNGGGRRGPKKDYIDPTRFVRVAKPTEEEKYVAVHKFNDFDIHPVLKANIEAKGFTAPSPIQDQTIPLGLDGKDVIGIANTGTGKTVAFAIPVLQRLATSRDGKALIVAPTRELAQQIQVEMRALGRGARVYDATLIGGKPMGPQLRDLERNPRLIIGTPGRIKDHLERRSLDLSDFDMVVLDEVDRMLDMGFVNDVRALLAQLSPQRQSFFFSATLDNRVKDLIQTFAPDAITVSVKTGDTSENVHQNVVRFGSPADKIDLLHDILNQDIVSKVIIFDDTQRSVEKLSQDLRGRGFNADAIHGGKSQGQRSRALRSFKENEITILVATDVAARGIDVADVSHVINFSTPQSYEDYVHRIGRAGRAGKIGHALTFIEQ